MLTRFFYSMFVVVASTSLAIAQVPPPTSSPLGPPATTGSNLPPVTTSGTNIPPLTRTDLSPQTVTPRPADFNTAPRANIRSSSVSIPADKGQYLETYDISEYTSRVKGTVKPEQAIIDWILRETGTDAWFNAPFGFMNASKSTLRVYHTKEMHEVVKAIIDRFVSSRPEPYVLGMRLITVGSPNWRVTALPLMQPVTVQSPGVEAWLMSKENAAVILAKLKRRGDFADKSSQDVVVENGQSQTISRLWPKEYVRTIQPPTAGVAGYSLLSGKIDEGYALQISPLFALNERTVDAVIKCNVDQVERLVPVAVDIPGTVGQQRIQIQVPQLVSWRLHERFRWPTDQVLLLSCGVVASPGPAQDNGPLGINKLLNSRGRADAMLFIECKGRSSQSVLDVQPRTARGGDVNSRGRY